MPPPTPPTTAPASPTSPASSDGDCIINVGTDPEKDDFNEKYADSSRSPTVATADVSKQTLNDKLKSCIPRLPHIPRPWRKEDGREKIISSMAEMEKKLLQMDDEDVELDELALQSRRRDRERTEEPSRASLIDKIDNKLKDYEADLLEVSDLFLQVIWSSASEALQQILAHWSETTQVYIIGWITTNRSAKKKPNSSGYVNALRYSNCCATGRYHPLRHQNSALPPEDGIGANALMQHKDDLIALAEKQEGGWFDGVLEEMLGIFPRSITRVRTSQLAFSFEKATLLTFVPT
ncbi:MAG: hypothetical protein Q9181_006648 [Wetmoreana brouardii]